MVKPIEKIERNFDLRPFTEKIRPNDEVDHKESEKINISDIIQKLSLAKDLETIMYIVRKAARKITESDGATFVLRDGNQCFYADEDAIAPLWKGKRFPMNICISGWVMENRQPVVIEDIYTDPRIPIDAYRVTFVKSLLMVPIRTDAPIGAIGAYWAESYSPTQEQVKLLIMLANSTSIAMENIMLQLEIEKGQQENSTQAGITKELLIANNNLESTLKELHHRTEQMQYLKELSSALQTCIHINEAYKLLAQYAGQILTGVSGVFFIMHPSRNYLESMVSWGSPKLNEKIIKPNECLGLRRGSVYQIEDVDKELICPHNKENSNSYTCIPLFAQSDILGLLYLEWEGFDKNNLNDIKIRENQNMLAGMIAEQISIGISNIQLRETLRNLSFRDGLTGLYNRRYLEETLEREMSRSKRNSAPLAIFMIDIDHFKNFNDQYGHEAGDAVLQAFANVLKNFMRKEDIACRYGGEEFMCVIPGVDSDLALQRTKELHEQVSQIHVRFGGNTLAQVTISIGVAIYPQQGENMHDLIAVSDTALYQAKNSGRNKTVLG